MSDLKGTVWARTSKDILGNTHTSYVRVLDHGLTHAHVQPCNAKGQLIFTFPTGVPTRQVQLSHEGTRVKGRKQVTL